MSEEHGVKGIWAGRAQRSLARDRQGPELARAKYRMIGPEGPRGRQIGPELDHIASTIERLKPAKILDVGTGYGMMWLWLTQSGLMPGLDYTACDWIDDYLDLHEMTTGIRPLKWDGIILPLDDDSFDFVISYSVLLHVPPEDIARHLGELVRVSGHWLYVHTARQMRQPKIANFNHDYAALFDYFGLHILDELISTDGQRVNWLLEMP